MFGIEGGLIIMAMVLNFSSALFSAYVASEKKRSKIEWFICGIVFGPVALLAIAGMPCLETVTRKMIFTLCHRFLPGKLYRMGLIENRNI